MRNLFFVAIALLPLQVLAAIQVTLTPSVSSPQPVGTPVTLTATSTDSNPGILIYRFDVVIGGVSRTIRDFSQANTLPWASSVQDGLYKLQVTVRNNTTKEAVQAFVPFSLTSRVASSTPVVSATANPLVALLSAPACPLGSKMRVQFGAAVGAKDNTDWRSCAARSSMNFYVAGMRASKTYNLIAQTLTGGRSTDSPTVSFTTGSITAILPAVTISLPASAQSSQLDNVLVSGYANLGGTVGFPIATDLFGNPIWYYAGFNDPAQVGAIMTRVYPGGTMMVQPNGINSGNSVAKQQLLREIDFAGNIVRETNATRVSEQLVAMGMTSSCVAGSTNCVFTAFHHDAIRLPNGHTIAFGVNERIFPTGTQGATAPVNIIGDILVELDENFQVVWFWDAYDHLDINRKAVLGETCTSGGPGCPPMYLTSVGNDWLHGNSVQYTADHNLIMSFRHQDWVVKIDYKDGAGTGNVIWRLGKDGDFSIAGGGDPYPWFSHQHDAAFEPNGTFTVFDDGNTRVAQTPGNSRGQALLVDENNRTTALILNSDLGLYSFALGSAQLLSNGNYHFLPGYNNPGPSQFSQSVEVLPTGVVNFRLQSPAPAYRSFRMKSLYAPPNS